jgi:hypothetical protein
MCVAFRFQNEMLELDLHALTDNLTKINTCIGSILDTFLQEVQEQRFATTTFPASHMLIALRRLEWLKPILEYRIEQMVEVWNGCETFSKAILRQCRQNVKCLGRKDWSSVLVMLENLCSQHEDAYKLWEAIRREATEECCYMIHPNLLLPCHEDVFCGLAIDLISDLSTAVIKHDELDVLFKTFMELAVKASAAVHNSVDMDKLTLASNCWKMYSLESRTMIKDQPEGTRCILTYVAPEIDPKPVIVDDLTIKDPQLRSIVHTQFYLCRQVIYGTLEPLSCKLLHFLIPRLFSYFFVWSQL